MTTWPHISKSEDCGTAPPSAETTALPFGLWRCGPWAWSPHWMPQGCGVGASPSPIELCRACHEGFCVHMNNLNFSVRALCPCLFTGSLSPSTVLGWLCPLGRVNWETPILRGAARGSVGGRCDPFTHTYEPTSKQSPSTIYAHSPFPKTASWSSYEEKGYDEAGTELDSSVVAGALSWEAAFPSSFFFDRTPQTHSQIMGYWSFGFST